ncbi:hypothetical protein GR138_12045 [Shinella kummerowiae]|uniref:Uncharacterized protein n=1 Tax=Shinella kummerowiae TaxID=417745 RepID=A0A6N8SA24_9HYPH|nr:hypothetical protein [Shinella kummerowiae]MXN45925.1 hypothetical protein [Shinella kummerowiae]
MSNVQNVRYQVDCFLEAGEDLIAKVDINFGKDDSDLVGDNLSIRVRLPPDARSMPFGNLRALAAKTAFQRLSDLASQSESLR